MGSFFTPRLGRWWQPPWATVLHLGSSHLGRRKHPSQGRGLEPGRNQFNSGSLTPPGGKRPPILVKLTLSGRVGRTDNAPVVGATAIPWGRAFVGEGWGLVRAQDTSCRKDRVLKSDQVGGSEAKTALSSVNKGDFQKRVHQVEGANIKSSRKAKGIPVLQERKI